MFKRCVSTAALVTFAVLFVGCATNTYRIPGSEMQRLATMPANDRWYSIRVVPADESTRHLAEVPSQVTATAEAPYSGEEPPPLRLEPFCPEDIVISSNAGPTEPPRFQPREGRARVAGSVRGTASAASTNAPAREGILRGRAAAPSTTIAIGRALPTPRFTAPTPSATAPTPSATASTFGAPAMRASRGVPAMPQHTSSGRSPSPGGGGNNRAPHLPSADSGDALVALVGIIVVVGLIAALASAATPDPPFDGWVAVHRNQDLHLYYDHGVRRIVPLNELHPTHLIGLRDTLVIDNAHAVTRLRYAP